MTDRQSDIEIYLKNITADALVDWLKVQFDGVDISKQRGGLIEGEVRSGSTVIPFTVFLNAVEKRFTSLCFASAETPWPTDLDCARAVHAALGCEIRCASNEWKEGDAETAPWWKLADGSETLIEWMD